MKWSLLLVAGFVVFGAAATARAGLLVFDAKQKTAVGPSYPTAPVTFNVAPFLAQGPPIVPVELLGLSLHGAFFGDVHSPLSMGLAARDNGSADLEPRGFGTNGFGSADISRPELLRRVRRSQSEFQ